jgi:hypothetical protein
MYWGCLACERQNPAKAIRCLGCGRSAKVALDHDIWDKYPPRSYFPVDAVIVAAEPEEEHEHQPITEDIADGVVGGGLAHVYMTYCRDCGEELEPEEPDDG